MPPDNSDQLIINTMIFHTTHIHHRGLVDSVSFSNGLTTSRAVRRWLTPLSTTAAESWQPPISASYEGCFLGGVMGVFSFTPCGVEVTLTSALDAMRPLAVDHTDRWRETTQPRRRPCVEQNRVWCNQAPLPPLAPLELRALPGAKARSIEILYLLMSAPEVGR